MNEKQRMQYLEAMGIDMYVPRFVLPGAKASVQCVLPVAEVASNEDAGGASLLQSLGVESATSSTSENSGLQNKGASPIAASNIVAEILDKKASAPARPENKTVPGATEDTASKLLGDVDSKDASQAAPKAEDARNSLQQLVGSKPKPVKFSLSLWWTPPGILVVDSRESRLALPTTTLLANMLYAVTGNAELPKSEVIKWPLMENAAIPQGRDEAREMVTAFVQGRLSAQPIQSVWLMGEDALLGLAESELAFDQILCTRKELESLSAPALVLPSLTHILQNPGCKAQVWAALKAFYSL